MSGLAILPDTLVAKRMDRLRADIDDGTWARRYGDLLQRATPSTGASASSSGTDRHRPAPAAALPGGPWRAVRSTGSCVVE